MDRVWAGLAGRVWAWVANLNGRARGPRTGRSASACGTGPVGPGRRAGQVGRCVGALWDWLAGGLGGGSVGEPGVSRGARGQPI